VAAGRGELGGPFKGARRRRRRPTAPGDRKEGSGKRIRDELESLDFQTDLAEDSKGEKVEEIPEIVSPLSIRPEKEKGRPDLEGKRRRRELGFRRRRREEDEGPDRWDPPVSDRTRVRGRQRTGPDWAEGKREKVLGRLSAQSQKRLFKTFVNLNYFLNAIPFIKNISLAQINPRKI
jgi:hypothetical protein